MAEPLGDASQAQLGHALPPETGPALAHRHLYDNCGRYWPLVALSSWAGMTSRPVPGESNSVPDRNGGKLCSRVTAELGGRIVAGDYVPDQVLPTEAELCGI